MWNTADSAKEGDRLNLGISGEMLFLPHIPSCSHCCGRSCSMNLHPRMDTLSPTEKTELRHVASCVQEKLALWVLGFLGSPQNNLQDPYLVLEVEPIDQPAPECQVDAA